MLSCHCSVCIPVHDSLYLGDLADVGPLLHCWPVLLLCLHGLCLYRYESSNTVLLLLFKPYLE